MTEQTSLSEILNSSTPLSEPKPQPEPTPEPEAVQTEPAPTEIPRDEQGRFAPKTETPPQAQQHQQEAPVAAVLEERRKRQEAEREREVYRQQLEQYQRQPAPSVLEDEEGWKQAQRQEQAAREALLLSKTVPDYQDAYNAVLEAAQANPTLEATIMTAPVPAVAILEEGRKIIEQRKREKLLEEIGDPATFEERVRAKVLAELQAQQPAPQPGIAALSLPPSLATTRSVNAPRTSATWSGPTPLGDILKRT